VEREELIAGKTYLIKSKEWFEENNIEFNNYHLCGKSMRLFEFGEKGYYNENDVEVGYKGEDGWWKRNYVPISSLELDPSDTRTVSPAVLEALEKIKQERFIYGYDGGPGGGEGGTIDTEKKIIAPAFDMEGCEGIYMKVANCRRIFTIDKINELFEKGETQQSFKFSEWTTIRTELKLIKDKSELPKRSSWSTMRD
jgi:hypothetical protein